MLKSDEPSRPSTHIAKALLPFVLQQCQVPALRPACLLVAHVQKVQPCSDMKNFSYPLL
jgi:hypothetical protein